MVHKIEDIFKQLNKKFLNQIQLEDLWFYYS
jgi:hypothetical protein